MQRAGSSQHQPGSVGTAKMTGLEPHILRIDGRTGSLPKPSDSQDFRPGDDGRGSADATGQPQGGPSLDADLATLVAAWPTLPHALHRAVLAILDATG